MHGAQFYMGVFLPFALDSLRFLDISLGFYQMEKKIQLYFFKYSLTSFYFSISEISIACMLDCLILLNGLLMLFFGREGMGLF